jgi:hypothetical protein
MPLPAPDSDVTGELARAELESRRLEQEAGDADQGRPTAPVPALCLVVVALMTEA